MKWKEIAKAWLDGKEVQYKELDKWCDIKSADALPNCALFSDFTEHRIKPKKQAYKIVVLREKRGKFPMATRIYFSEYDAYHNLEKSIGRDWDENYIVVDVIESVCEVS